MNRDEVQELRDTKIQWLSASASYRVLDALLAEMDKVDTLSRFARAVLASKNEPSGTRAAARIALGEGTAGLVKEMLKTGGDEE